MKNQESYTKKNWNFLEKILRKYGLEDTLEICTNLKTLVGEIAYQLMYSYIYLNQLEFSPKLHKYMGMEEFLKKWLKKIN